MTSAAAASLETLYSRAAPSGRTALDDYRVQAMTRLKRLGLPNVRDESWRYTDLRELLGTVFTAAAGPQATVLASSSSASVASFNSALRGNEDWPLVVLRNARLIGSSLQSGQGFEVMSLRDCAEREPERLRRLLPQLSDDERSRWALANAASLDDGIVVRVAGICPTPLVILHCSEQPRASIAHSRVLIEALPGSRATMIEHHVSAHGDQGVTNHVSAVHAGEDARLEHYRVIERAAEAAHFDHLQVRCAHDAHVEQHTVCLGASLTRANCQVDLLGERASCDAYALLSAAERTADAAYWVTHAARATVSRQTARVIASGRGRGVFNSLVHVDAKAQQSDSRQSCRGLLLSAGAEIDVRPQLEIYTDDVSCVHGATVGRLDEEMLFYLLSRGLDKNTAHALLVFAFLADVLKRMSLGSVRAAVEAKLIEALPDAHVLKELR